MSEIELGNAVRSFAPVIVVSGLGLTMLFQGLTKLGDDKTKWFGIIIIFDAVLLWLITGIAIWLKSANNDPWLENRVAGFTIIGIGINILFQGWSQYVSKEKKWSGILIVSVGALILFAGLFALLILWGDSYCCALLPTIVLFILCVWGGQYLHTKANTKA